MALDFPSHHLWLLPAAGQAHTLRECIAAYAERLGGPGFAPHVTLVGSLPGDPVALTAVTRTLALNLAPLEVPVVGLVAGASHFQSVFLVLARTAELNEARAAALGAFAVADTPYLPHLSLAYGGPVEKRAALVEAEASLDPGFCTLDRLALVRAATEHPQDWTTVVEVNLSPP